MTHEELENFFNDRIEPELDPEKTSGLLVSVCKDGHASLLARRMGPNAMTALAIQLLKAAEEMR
jgi:hypothetical protein